MNSLRWGILGTAGIARTVIAAIRRRGAGQVRAVASREASRARAWADDLDIPLAYGSYDALLASGEVDVVYNPLPNTLHAQWSIAALEAGYPVLCEKPFAMNRTEAEAVLQTSRRTGRPVAEAFMYRFHPMFARALALLDSGTIGDLVAINSRFSFYEENRNGLAASAELGGGALMDVGCYCVNFARLAARAEPVRVAAVSAGTQVDETFMGLLEFPRGVLARCEASIASTESHDAEIVGSTGSIVFPSPWLPGLEDTSIVVRRWQQSDEVIPVRAADAYGLEVADFARAVMTRTPPRWPVADAVANMAVIDALVTAAQSRAHFVPLDSHTPPD